MLARLVGRPVRSVEAGGAASKPEPDNYTPLERYAALAGLILWIGRQAREEKGLTPLTPLPTIDDVFSRYRDRRDEIVKEILKIYPLVAAGSQSKDATAAKPPGDGDAEGTSAKIFMISLNRPVTSALEKSVPAVKADAARTLFDVKCNKIVWAVLDSGIDASHTASSTEPARRARRACKRPSISPISATSSAATTTACPRTT